MIHRASRLLLFPTKQVSWGLRYFGASDYDIYLNGLSRFIQKSGNLLLSHIVSNIVPSAARVLTIVFGMRTGVSLWRIVT